MSAHWTSLARQWSLVGPPLRPSFHDLDCIRHTLPSLLPDLPANPTIAILGATAEYATLPFPPHARLLAFDQSAAMLQLSRHAAHRHITPVAARWQSLPVPDAALDLTLTDGGLNVLPSLDAIRDTAAELARTLRPGASVFLRLYAPVAPPETPDAVLSTLERRQIRDLNELKLRLWLALSAQNPSTAAIRLSDVYETFTARFPDLPALATHLQWPLPHLDVIRAYQNSPAAYVFPMVARTIAAFDGFTHLRTFPTHPHFPQCPTLLLRRNSAPDSPRNPTAIP